MLASLKARIDRLPSPSTRVQLVLAVLAVCTQALIAVTGSVVRVTGSGLGCSTWPQCQPGSFVPIAHPELSQLNQWIEYGNRMLTGVVGFVAAACVAAAWLAAPRRTRVVRLALVLFGGVVAQAILGGVTVRTGLLWWIVATHFLASSVLVWFAVFLVRAIGEGDERPRRTVHDAVGALLPAMAGVLAALLLAGTLVTGAGPHAGDTDTPRLDLPIDTLAHVHGALLFVFLGMLAGLGFMLRVGGVSPLVWRRYLLLVAAVLAQGLVGLVQYWTGVPGALVSTHVAGAELVTVATAALWCATRDRGPLPVVNAEVHPAPEQASALT